MLNAVYILLVERQKFAAIHQDAQERFQKVDVARCDAERRGAQLRDSVIQLEQQLWEVDNRRRTDEAKANAEIKQLRENVAQLTKNNISIRNRDATYRVCRSAFRSPRFGDMFLVFMTTRSTV